MIGYALPEIPAEIEVKICVPHDMIKEVILYHLESLQGERDEYDAHSAVQEWLESQIDISHQITDEIIDRYCIDEDFERENQE